MHIIKYYLRMREYVFMFQSVKIVQRDDKMTNKIPYVENLTDLFTKTLMGKVLVGHRDNLGFT